MIGKIGEGAYGQVWSALHISTEILYAIKVINKKHVEKVISLSYITIQLDKI